MRFLVISILLLSLLGCAKTQLVTADWAANTETGNKIYAYQDIEPKEKTAIIIVRVEGENSVQEMTKMMQSIENVFTAPGEIIRVE